jgi:hypothetical protein
MLGQPSLQYSIGRFLTALLFNYKSQRGRFHSYPLITLPHRTLIQAGSDYIGIAVDVIIAAILAMIATIIGANLIAPVATAVGGALNNKNLTGAANSLTAQLTLLFVVVVILIPVTFIAVFGKIVKTETS